MSDEQVSDIAVTRRMRGLDRAFEILDFLRERRKPARPNEIAVGIDAPKSTAYELVNLLLRLGVLEHTDDDGRVYLGRKLYFLGEAWRAAFDLTRECKAHLARLAEATRETAQLCMLDGRKYTVAMMKEGARPFRISSDIGEQIPIPWTASGRLLVAHMSDEEILALIPAGDFVLPDGEVLDVKTFLAQVRAARRQGFYSHDTITDNFTHCFSAPIFQGRDICVATLCLVAPRDDAARNYARYRDALVEEARDLTSKLGDAPVRFSTLAYG